MLRRYAAVLTTVLLSALPAIAQTYTPEPPKKGGGDQSVMIEWVIGTVFLIGCLVVAFKPAKRSNLR